jgi:D-glycero-D-manno-heptose 1,7-bisphosphate phosphatase
MKALFLDRDGTIIFHKPYLSDPAQVELLPGAAVALRRAIALNYRLFLFTNQSGIGRGFYTLEDARRCNARMEDLIGLGSPLFMDSCIAAEAPDQESRYRKPSPRFIAESVARFGLNPACCWMVGDNECDIQSGERAGIQVAALCSGVVSAEAWTRWPRPGLPVFQSLLDFANALG